MKAESTIINALRDQAIKGASRQLRPAIWSAAETFLALLNIESEAPPPKKAKPKKKQSTAPRRNAAAKAAAAMADPSLSPGPR